MQALGLHSDVVSQRQATPNNLTFLSPKVKSRQFSNLKKNQQLNVQQELGLPTIVESKNHNEYSATQFFQSSLQLPGSHEDRSVKIDR